MTVRKGYVLNDAAFESMEDRSRRSDDNLFSEMADSVWALLAENINDSPIPDNYKISESMEADTALFALAAVLVRIAHSANVPFPEVFAMVMSAGSVCFEPTHEAAVDEALH